MEYKADFRVCINTVEKVKKFVNLCSQINGDIDLYSGRYNIDAKSIMGIFSLDISKVLVLRVKTADPIEVKKKLSDFIVTE